MAEEEQEEQVVGAITITITDNNVKYDTSFSLPEMVFWIEAVKDIAIKQALEPGE